ncbi:MAG TPA: S1C family serine protease [Bacillota bacterium]|nr:S1C family serine protease [Bacillota bacterium]
MKKANDKPVQALLAISVLALAAFVLMAIVVPGVTDRLIQDKDPLNAKEPAPVVGATASIETTKTIAYTSPPQTVSKPNESGSNQTRESTVKSTQRPDEVEIETDPVYVMPTDPDTTTTETGPDIVDPDTSTSEPDPDETDPLSGKSVSYLSDERIKDIFQKYSQMVASIQVYLPGTDSTNDKMAIFSGLIISDDGQIITFSSNFSFALAYGDRLYDQAEVLIVIPGKPRGFEASLQGIQRDTDLALFQIENVSGLPYAELETESELGVGDPIIAIGQNDVLMSSGGLLPGLITAIYHPTVLENSIKLSMIQTSAFISQEASGGPLINLAGEVIGLNNSHLNRSYSDIMGYAVSTPSIKAALEILNDSGHRESMSWLGIITIEDEENEKLLKLMEWPAGLYVASVSESSPSYIAGIRKGDILISINGVSMKSHETYSEFVKSQPVGTLTQVRLYRTTEKRFMNLQIYLGSMP